MKTPEKCPKCGFEDAMPEWVPLTEELKYTCLCGYFWFEKPLDYKNTDSTRCTKEDE